MKDREPIERAESRGSSPRCSPWTIVIVAALLMGACEELACCGNSINNHYLVSTNLGTPAWNGITTDSGGGDPDFVEVLFAERATPTVEMIEIYDGPTRLAIPGTLARDLGDDHGCAHYGLRYDLRSLPNGEYLLVHRTSSAPPGMVLIEGEARYLTTYDGEPALVTTLLRDDVGVSDAGSGDGGP